MGWVMISCPVTGRAISTGIETDHFSLKQVRSFTSRCSCQACGGEHAWSNFDAWICDTSPRAMPSEGPQAA
jgi:hypothetical protein